MAALRDASGARSSDALLTWLCSAVVGGAEGAAAFGGHALKGRQRRPGDGRQQTGCEGVFRLT